MSEKAKHEQRMMSFRAVDSDDGKMIIEGVAIVYDTPATHTWGDYTFTETIKRGALDGADMSDVPLRYNHNDDYLIMARTRNKSLQLMITDAGLTIRAELIDTQSNRDIYAAVKAGLVDKMSFAFDVAEGGDTITDGRNQTMREVTRIHKIYDVSVVDTPFYDTTSVYARSLELMGISSDNSEVLELEKRKLVFLLTNT